MQKIRQLTILTTNKCTASCEHCSMDSDPHRKGRLSLSTIVNTIENLIANENKPNAIIFAGGEPTLLRQHLFDAIAYCSEHGINTRLVTNASWAKDEQKTKEMIENLRECGLSEINYSVDDYHVNFISFENIMRAWRHSKNKGFGTVAIANCYGKNTKVTSNFILERLNENIPIYWDDDGKYRHKSFLAEDGTNYFISNARLQRLGRGKNIPENDLIYPSRQSDLNIKCQWAVRSAALSADGRLVACCGIEANGNEFLDFGDVKNNNAYDLIKDAENRVVIKAIRNFGPYFLMQFVKGFCSEKIFKDKYSSICEICEDVVNIELSKKILRENLTELYPLYNSL
ncbi:radical SAM protein [Klebsiella aerogenes]|uniref:radical SAM protein n=1 Tax=Klebsiella aerogenes TaxID=548 RepID=UPI00291B4305|nr:radical SAM protein [Klebsiella aerogenes]MDU9139240.1 radical SAM protein [Klebsiella aerogenes]